MALTTEARALPLGAMYAGGLALLFVGERLLVGLEVPRYLCSGLGVALMAASAGLRFVLAGNADRPGDLERGPGERRLAFLSVGGLLAVALYFTTTDAARLALGIAAMSPDKRAKVEAVQTIAWVGALALSALPLLFGELALAPMRRADRVEARRVRAAIRAGATIALALVYCSLFVFAAGQLDWKLDYSYFRTSKPSESTTNIAASATEPIEVTAFFPAVNDVGTEVEGYLRDLAHAAPNLKITTEDRLLKPQLAKDKKVTSDGVIVLTRGASREAVTIGVDPKTAASKLKNLDQDFQKSLLKVLREARVAYLTTGHGELNEAGEGKVDGRTSKLMKGLLEGQNYIVKDLGITQGLANDVPNDAALVVVLGPTRAFSPEEIAAMNRYADKGGHLLLALDPEGGADLAPLAAAVGLTWGGVTLANERVFVPRRHNASDHAFIGSNRYSSHASISTLSRYGSSKAVVF
ncbi:MAG TPA: Gldg family protein, partial [Byssovorax sp.]